MKANKIPITKEGAITGANKEADRIEAEFQNENGNLNRSTLENSEYQGAKKKGAFKKYDR